MIITNFQDVVTRFRHVIGVVLSLLELDAWRRDDDVIKVISLHHDRVEVIRPHCWPGRLRFTLRACRYERNEKKIRDALDKSL